MHQRMLLPPTKIRHHEDSYVEHTKCSEPHRRLHKYVWKDTVKRGVYLICGPWDVSMDGCVV